MTDQSRLKENELKALAYFVVGVSSEGSIAGKDVSNRLSFAGSYRDGKMYPVQNSGLSIGTLQKDLGQDNRETALALVDAYHEWTAVVSKDVALTEAQRASLVSDLSRNGEEIKRQNNRPIDAGIKDKLDKFLRSDGGRDFVHRRDSAQVDHIYTDALTKLMRTTAYEHASMEERIKLAAVVSKAFNQNELVAGKMLAIMVGERTDPERLTSFEDVQAYTDRKFSRVMSDGRDAALRGAEIYGHLKKADPQNPLGEAWREVLSNPLIKPSQVSRDPRPDFAAQYTTIKNLFLEPITAKHFVNALEQGAEYSRGSPQAVGARKATSGFFVSGAKFVQWNADGSGVAYSDGVWSQLSRDDITRVRQTNGAVDLSIDRNGTREPLLHVGPATMALDRATAARSLHEGARGDDVRALQTQLAELGFTDARGRPLRADGDFGAATHLALQAFQREHRLLADGVAGRQTHDALLEAVRVERLSFGQPNAPYMQFDPRIEAVSPVQALTPEPVHSEPLLPTIPPGSLEREVNVPQAAGDESVESHAIRSLQENLNTLGVADMNGRPLNADGIYDRTTQSAVAQFQFDQRLPITGQADEATISRAERQAFIADLQRRAEPAIPREMARHEVSRPLVPEQEVPDQASVSHSVTSQGPASLSLHDPRHPESPTHALYNELQSRILDASDEWILQFTATCHKNMITADNLVMAHLDEENLTMHFRGSDPLSTPAHVDFSALPPTPQEAIQQIQQFDQQEMLLAQAFQMQQAQSMSQGRSM